MSSHTPLTWLALAIYLLLLTHFAFTLGFNSQLLVVALLGSIVSAVVGVALELGGGT